MVLIIFKQTA